MKRISYWAMSTLTVLVLLFGYRTSTSSQPEAAAPVAIGARTGSGAATSNSGAATSNSTTPPPTPDPAGTAEVTTVTGSAADTRYGPVQVQLGVQGDRIVDVEVVQYPDSNGRDREINAQALPVLVSETESAQNAQIDMVSGATYTSQGYLTSLQSALDQAGLK